jgi:hypothetical protein
MDRDFLFHLKLVDLIFLLGDMFCNKKKGKGWILGEHSVDRKASAGFTGMLSIKTLTLQTCM